MNVAINATGRDNHALSGDDFSRGADDDGDTWLHIRVTSLTDATDTAILDPDVSFDNPPPVNDDGIGQHRVSALSAQSLRLSHAVANNLASPELDFLAINCEVLLDFTH